MARYSPLGYASRYVPFEDGTPSPYEPYTPTGDADMGVGLDPVDPALVDAYARDQQYGDTLPPMLEPGVLTQNNPPTRGLQLPDFGAPIRDFANAPDVNLPGVGEALFRGAQELARGTQPTERGKGMQEAGYEYDIPVMRGLANIGEKTIGRQDAETLANRWYNGTPVEKVLDIGGQAIPTGAMPFARAALPGGVMGGALEVAGELAGGTAVGPTQAALRAASGVNDALPDSLKLVGGSRAAQRGQVPNPLSEMGDDAARAAQPQWSDLFTIDEADGTWFINRKGDNRFFNQGRPFPDKDTAIARAADLVPDEVRTLRQQAADSAREAERAARPRNASVDAVADINLPHQADDDLMPGDVWERVVWDTKRGQDIDMNPLDLLGVDGKEPGVRGIHVGDPAYWRKRLQKDYGRSGGRTIKVRVAEGDRLIDDPQYVTDPDTSIKADSAVLLSTREKLRYGTDWVFANEEFKAAPTPPRAQPSSVLDDVVPPKPPPPPAPPNVGPTGQPAQGSVRDGLHQMWREARHEPSLPERLNAFKNTIGDKYRSVQEAVTDRYAGLNALSPESERAVALAQGIPDAQMQRAADISEAVKGALGKAWDTAADDLDDWLHAKQAIDLAAVYGDKRKIPGGIKGAAGAQDVLNDIAATLGPDRYARLEAAGQAAVAESAATLNKLVDEGLVSSELADTLLTKYPHYNKQNILRAVDDELSAGRQLGKSPLSVTSSNLKTLTEEGTEKARTSPYASIIGSAADAEALIFRNRAAKQVAEDAIAQGLGKRIAGTKKVATVEGEAVYRRPPGDIPGTISYMENGQRVVVEVPSYIEKAAKDIGRAQNDALTKVGRVMNALPRAAFVTYNPAWPAANLVTDYLTVAMTKGVTPLEELRGLWGAVKDLSGNDPVLAQMRRSGAGQAGWFAKDAVAVDKLVRQSGNLAITTQPEWQKLLSRPWKLLGAPFKGIEAVGQVAEQGTRRAVFTTALKRGADLDVAALEARRATIDFARGGSMSKAINNFSLFFNTAVQGALLPGRVLRDSPRARWGLGAAMAANLGVYAWNRQFPEYEDVPRDVKRGSAILMLPSDKSDANGRPVPRYVSFIPKTREWGLFFGTMNYVMEALDGKAKEEFGDFLKLQMAQATPLEASNIMVTQPGQVAGEQWANYDFYRQKPIVPPELEGKPATEQYDQYTSETIKEIAQKLGMSPMRLQHVFSGMTGGTGRTITSITDPLVDAATAQPDPRIVALNDQLQAISPANGVPADEVQLRRREFLNGLDTDTREKLSDLMREPKDQVPVLGGVVGRFVGERGGELNRLGREKAAATTGASITQTQQVSKTLGDVYGILDQKQEQWDTALASGTKTAKEWREGRQENAQQLQGALMALGVAFPGAAQVGDRARWVEWQKAMYTLAGQVDDRRTKGQLLAAGYRAIPLESTDPLTKDFDTFFQKRAEYMAALDKDDRELLKRTLEASMTPTEKRYAAAQETLRPYWELKEQVQSLNPVFQRVTALRAELDGKTDTASIMRLRALNSSEEAKAMDRNLELRRNQFLLRNADADKALTEWYGTRPVRLRMALASQ